MMRRQSTCKQLTLVLMLAVLFTTCFAATAEESIKLTSVPEPNTAVKAGDVITFALQIQDTASVEQWGAIQVSMLDGLEFQPDTIQCSIASATDGVFDVVPGNDGFLLLPDGLMPGDSISFEAVVTQNALTPKCVLQTDAFTLETAYLLAAPQTAESPAEVSPEVSMESGTEAPAAYGWLIVAAVALITVITPVLLFRDKLQYWYRKMKKKLMKKKRQAIHADQKQKDHAQ